MICWIIYLRFQLPRTYTAQHWRMAWIGFDIGLFVSLAVTINSYLKHTTRRIPAGIVAATFLFIDSWFDVITSQKGSDRIAAIVMALFLQIPLGVFLIRRSNHLWREILAH